jgi:TonB-linked SusC/RagA family outer membrane protein
MFKQKTLPLKILFTIIIAVVCGTTYAQQNETFTGRVIDSTNHSGIPNVSVRIKGNSKAGTITNDEGNFTITAPQGSVLMFSAVNYKTFELQTGNDLSLNAVLAPNSSELNEVVVIGYGTRQRKDVTGAISTVDSKDIRKTTALTPELALQGHAAGVTVISGGGDPSARPIVRVRGVSSFNYADPLYVIDGIPLEEGGRGATPDPTNDPTRRTPINLLTIINPNDIASITVLKDAAATAVYGVRGANGVILITTKSGKKGRVRVDLDGKYGIQKIPKTYSFLNTQQFTQFITDAYNAHPDPDGNGGSLPIGKAPEFGAVWDPASPDYLGNSPTYDWQKAIINNDAKIEDYDLRVSGASDNTNYNFSGGYANNDGPFLGTNENRYSFSTNVNSKVGKYFETGLNLRLIQEKTHDASFNGGTPDLSIYKAAPWQPVYDPSNPYGYAPLWALNRPITPDSFLYRPLWQSLAGPGVAISNYLGLLATNDNPTTNQTFLGSGYIQLQPVAGLKIKGVVSGQQLGIVQRNYRSFDSWQFGETPGNPYSGVKNPVPGERYNAVGIFNSTTTSLNKSLNVDYLHSFGKNNIDVTLNASQEEWLWKTNGVSSYVTTDDPDLRYFNATGNETGSDELHGHYVLIGYLARLDYNYESKYYLDVLARRDGSSRFAPGHQWGTFPAGSAGWRISQEKFMSGLSFINDLKIRGGYGVLGNEQTTPDDILSV